MEESFDTADHRHWWKIDQANGPTSAGICKHCGANRQFRNWLTETDFMGREELTGASAPNSFPVARSTSPSW